MTGVQTCALPIYLVPEFVRYAADRDGGRDRVLAVVHARPGETDLSGVRALVRALSPVARVVDGTDADAVAAAFGVRGWPAVGTVDAGGRLTTFGPTMAAAREAVRS